MGSFREGYRRLAWVASGALLFVWSWHVYSTFSEDYGWDDSARWIYVSIVAAILIALPHVALYAATWVKGGFFGTTNELQANAASPAESLNDERLAERNITVINTLAHQISSAIVGATPNPETNHGSMHDVLARMMHSTSCQYAFAMVQLSRLRKRRDFFNSTENTITKSLLANQIAQESAAFTSEVGVESDKNFIVGQVTKEVDAVSLAASRLVRLMINNKLDQTNNPLHAWFKEAFGIESVGGQSIDTFTKSMLRVAHQELESRGG